MFDINEIKKDLYKSKNMAKFSHYQSGELFYTVEIASGKYQFPISTTEKALVMFEHYFLNIESIDGTKGVQTLKLSDDLGSTPFEAEMRGSELIRWMQMAMKTDSFIKIG